MAQYRKFISEAQKYYQERLAAFRFREERLDCFLSELLHSQKEYEGMWWTLALSHCQAAVERGFSVNKEVLAPNIEEISLTAIRLVHSSVLAEKSRWQILSINEELLCSCRYRMNLMDKNTAKHETERRKKRGSTRRTRVSKNEKKKKKNYE